MHMVENAQGEVYVIMQLEHANVSRAMQALDANE